MSCPLFEDYSRGCVEEFPEIVKFSKFEICESEEYLKCPLYIIINSKFRCQYFITCLHNYFNDIPMLIEKIFLDEKVKGDIIIGLAKKYCLSEDNHMKCLRYKLLEQGKKPPLTLLSDGRKIHSTELLLKKKLTIDVSE